MMLSPKKTPEVLKPPGSFWEATNLESGPMNFCVDDLDLQGCNNHGLSKGNCGNDDQSSIADKPS
jgi:hypothetical protein